MKLILLIITIILFLAMYITILLFNSSVKAKNEALKSLTLSTISAIHASNFTDCNITNTDEIVNKIVSNINYQINDNSELVESSNIVNNDGIVEFTLLKTYKWLNLIKYVQFDTGINMLDFTGNSNIEETNEEIVENETKTVTFLVDHAVYSQSTFEVGEQIEPPTTPLKPKYRFVGWYVKGDLNKDIISDEEWSQFRIAEDMTFVAQFKAKY